MKKLNYFEWLWSKPMYIVSFIGALTVDIVATIAIKDVSVGGSILIAAIGLGALSLIITNTVMLWKKS